MGYSLSWIAVKNAAPQAVQEALSLRTTGTREDSADSKINGTELPGGWYLVTSDHDDLHLTKDAVLGRLSQLGEVIMCFVEEHCMYSTAACWRAGQCVWSIIHDSQKGIEHVEGKGALPANFAAIRDRQHAKQKLAGGGSKKAGVDHIFDIPVNVAEELVGYRYDSNVPGLAPGSFEIFISAARGPLHRPWWQKLLGR